MVSSQTMLSANGKAIVNTSGDTIIRGMGPGGWTLQEGYMLKTAGFAHAQFQIRNKIEAMAPILYLSPLVMDDSEPIN